MCVGGREEHWTSRTKFSKWDGCASSCSCAAGPCGSLKTGAHLFLVVEREVLWAVCASFQSGPSRRSTVRGEATPGAVAHAAAVRPP